MDLLLLKYFKKVAESSSMTVAAAELRVAQPAISKMIKKLEEELGCQVFDRTSRSLALNDAGRVLLRYANRIFDSVEEARDEIGDFMQNGRRVVKIQVLAGSRMFADIVSKFTARYPDSQFQISQSARPEEEFDLRLFSSARPPKADNCRVILREQIVLAAPLRHALSEREQVSLAELREENFLALAKGLALRAMTDSFCLEEGFMPKVICDVDNPAFLREIIAAGLGIAFLPAVSWGNIPTDKIKALTLEGGRLTRCINLAWRKGKYLPAMAGIFRDFVVEYYRKLQ